MDKKQIISFIEEQLKTGNISKNDLLSISQGLPSTSSEGSTKEDSSRRLINTFYSIGAIIALVGVAILIAQNWNEIGFGGRILVTLGISIVTYISALLLRSPEQKVISQVMFTLAAALAPLGSYVLLNEASINFTWGVQLMTAIILFVVFGAALFISKRNILLLISIGFATWAYYTLILKAFGDGIDDDYLKWATMLLGVSYILIGYGYKLVWPPVDQSDDHEKRALQKVLYGFGTLTVLSAGIVVGDNFDLFYIILIFGAFYGSVYLRSRAMLLLASLFLMGHIIKLTGRYFVDSIGWPVALIIVGFLVIGVGYMTFFLNRKFISSR